MQNHESVVWRFVSDKLFFQLSQELYIADKISWEFHQFIWM